MRYVARIVLAALLSLGVAGQVWADEAATWPETLDILKLPEWKMTASNYGGKLLLSDSPEMVTTDGIMYQDKVEGDVRLFFHHVNATSVPKKICVLIENSGTETAHVTVYRYGIAGPGFDWLAVGKAAQTAYLAGSKLYVVKALPKETASLSTRLNDAVVQPNMLVNGIFDFIADRPVTIKVLMMPLNADVSKFSHKANILPKDIYRLRGTFEGHDRLLVPDKIYNPAIDGPVVVTLGDDNIDLFQVGIDATDGSSVTNYGNWGVVYKLFLPSDDKGNLTYYLNPRGGTYAGAMGIMYQHLEKSPVATPSDRTFFGTNELTDFALVGKFDGGQSLWVTFSPPGASNLPIKLVILPH
jgi:hypothetical protein